MAANDTKKTLRDRIRSLLVQEFDGLSPDAVAGILSGLASELIQFSEAGVATVSEALDESEVESSEISYSYGQDGAINVIARAEEQIADVINQVLNVGALLVRVDPAPKLNSLVHLRISLPAVHLECIFQGRVVHVSEKGSAIELGQMTKEDRASFEAIWPTYQGFLNGVKLAPAAGPQAGVAPNQTMHANQPSVSASDSVAIPLGAPRTTRQLKQIKRRVDITDPDVKVLTSTQFGLKAVSTTREFYGPENLWLQPGGEPERVEALAEDRIADIFLQLSEHASTGLIEVNTLTQAGPLKRQLLLDSGFVVEVSRLPREADEELGLMLLRADRITKQQLAMSAAHADENEQSLARSLVDLQILEPDRVRHAIAGRLTFLLGEVLKTKTGDVRFYDGANLPSGFLPAPPLRVHVPIERVLFQRLFENFKTFPLKDREAMLDPAMDAYPEIVPDESERIERTLEASEHKVLIEKVITGRRRMREVFTESNLAHADTFAVVQSLHRMGLLRFDRSLHQTVVRERMRENVTVKYLSVHKASYFEVLNVHWSAYDEVVEKAYQELSTQFDPQTVPQSLEPEVHQRVVEIRERVESAYQVLSARETRHSYRKRIMPEYKLAHAIPLFLKQSELAEKRRQWNEAMDSLKRVTEIDPNHRDARIKMDHVKAILENRLSPDATDSNF